MIQQLLAGYLQGSNEHVGAGPSAAEPLLSNGAFVPMHGSRARDW